MMAAASAGIRTRTFPGAPRPAVSRTTRRPTSRAQPRSRCCPAMGEEIATPGSHPDIHSFVAGLSAARRTQLMALEPLLSGWSLETPAATDPNAPMADVMDSAATSVFNAWVRRFLVRAFSDEL